jgi:hypothetical protein
MHIILKIFYLFYISTYTFTWIIFVVEFYKFNSVARTATLRDGAPIVNWIYWISIQTHSITVYTVHNRLAAESLYVRPLQTKVEVC